MNFQTLRFKRFKVNASCASREYSHTLIPGLSQNPMPPPLQLTLHLQADNKISTFT